MLTVTACGLAEERTAAAAEGCFDADIEPVDVDPDKDLADIESDARQLVDERIDRSGLPYSAGEVTWAEHGQITLGHSTQPDRVAWVIVFELEPDSWLTRFRESRFVNRWSVLYHPEEQMISGYCPWRA